MIEYLKFSELPGAIEDFVNGTIHIIITLIANIWLYLIIGPLNIASIGGIIGDKFFIVAIVIMYLIIYKYVYPILGLCSIHYLFTVSYADSFGIAYFYICAIAFTFIAHIVIFLIER